MKGRAALSEVEMYRSSPARRALAPRRRWWVASALVLAVGCGRPSSNASRTATAESESESPALPESTDTGLTGALDSGDAEETASLGSSCAHPISEYGTRAWPSDDPTPCADGRYRVLEGNLRIEPEEPTADLSALSCVCRIEGSLLVESPSLESMAGMPELEAVAAKALFDEHGHAGVGGYPAPIVEHKSAYREARSRISKVRSTAVARDAAAEVLDKHGSRRRPQRPQRKRA